MNPVSIECLIYAHEEVVFQGIGLKFYENVFKRLIALIPKLSLPSNWVATGQRYLKYSHVD